MNVAFISFDSNMFGSERSMLDVLGRLDRERVSPRVILVRTGPLEEAVRGVGIAPVLLPWLAGPFHAYSPSAYAAAVRLALWLRRENIEIVELNRLSFGHLAVMNMAARLAGCQTVVRVRMPGAELTLFQKLALTRCDRIVSVSRSSIEPWSRGWTPEGFERLLSVVPDSREISKLKRIERDGALTRKFGIPAGAPVVGMVGAITANKRQDLFLRAAELILREVPDARFVIVGEVLDLDSLPFRESLARLLEGQPWASRVIYTGYRSDALTLMKHFDVLVVPSDREALGGVLIEAMALGVPVVAHRVDGMPEVVEDGVTGALVDRQEPRLYAEAVARLLKNPAEAERLTSAASRAVERYESRRVAEMMEGIYDGLARPRIGTVSVSFDSNMFGSERSMLDVLGNVDRARFEPRLVLVRPGPLADAARARQIGVTVFPWLEGPFLPTSPAFLVAAARLAAWLRRERVEIVDLNRLSFGHLMVVNIAARLAGCRTVVRVRMHAEALSYFQKLTLLGSDAIIPVSAGSIALWRNGSTSPALERRLRVIHNSRDVKSLKRMSKDAALLRALGVPAGAKVAGMVGAITANKRQDLFLSAAERVLREVPDAWFVIVGGVLDPESAEYDASLYRFLEGKPLAGRVVFAGYRDDAYALMKNFDVLVLSSDHEAFGGVMLESMALGVPVVAHAVDGTPELISDGVNGILIPRQDAALYAAAVARLLTVPAEASRLAAAAAIAIENFDSAVIARKNQDVYAELARRAPAGAGA